MSLLGIHLTLLIGPTVAVPAPIILTEALESVEVTHSDQGRNGFQLTFIAGRSGPEDIVDYRLLASPLLRPFNRVILVITFNVTPHVLIDGVITNRQFSPGAQPGASRLTLTGEDVSLMMDLEEKQVEHPAQNETLIASKIILSYAQFGLIPMVIPPPSLDFPIPIERTPVQQETDLRHLQTMAERYGYVFYIRHEAPFLNVGYWGPPVRVGLPQRALSVNMGPETNVESINFQYNALAPTVVSGKVQDSRTDQAISVQTFSSLRPPLVSQPALPFNLPNVRTTLLKDTDGLNVVQAYARAQGMTDKSVDQVVTASGELDALRYGDLLQPRNLVGLRGVGYTHDGMYYVQSVSHKIRHGEYKQSFTLTREGDGALFPFVRP